MQTQLFLRSNKLRQLSRHCVSLPSILKQSWFIVILLFTTDANAQDSLRPVRSLTYQVKLNLRDGKKVSGYLRNITDTTVTCANKKSVVGSFAQVTNKTFGYRELFRLRLRRTGGSERGGLIGLGAGAAVGAIAGFAAGDDPPPRAVQAGWFNYTPKASTAGEKAGVLAIIIGLPAAVIGAVIGDSWKKFEMKGGPTEMAKAHQMIYKNIYSINDFASAQSPEN